MRRAILLILLPFFALPARGGAELRLLDGSVLGGESVERKGSQYLLHTKDEIVIPIPVELVKEMRLTGGDAPPPTGLTYGEPTTLVGPEMPVPGWREQLAAFGRPPALFQGSAVASRWIPENAFAGKDFTEFNPVRWRAATIDPVWRPTSDYTAATDVTRFRPVRWRQPSISPYWQPKDSWGPSIWFAPVVVPRRE